MITTTPMPVKTWDDANLLALDAAPNLGMVTYMPSGLTT
jgi:hypothetical protein